MIHLSVLSKNGYPTFRSACISDKALYVNCLLDGGHLKIKDFQSKIDSGDITNLCPKCITLSKKRKDGE